jgi:alkylation response protein AidB-like acyl-CoA dehydrogenase
LAKNAARYDQASSPPIDDYEALRDAGYYGMLVPEEYGGWGLDLTTYGLVMHELGQGAAATATAFNMHHFCMWQIKTIANEAFQSYWFPRLMSEQALVGGWGSEPGAGLSQGRFLIGTTIAPQGEDLILNGSKFFCTLAGVARYAQVLVSTAEDAAETTIDDITTVIVPVDLAGITIGTDWDVLGMRATVSPAVRFDNVVIPKANMLGRPGHNIITAHLAEAISVGYAAINTAVARSALDFAVQYAVGKRVGMNTHADSPLIQQRIGELASSVEASYATMLRAAEDLDQDFLASALSHAGSTSRAVAMRTVLDVTSKAFEICGGTTVSQRFPLGRLHREARTMTLMNPGYDGILSAVGRDLVENAKRRRAEQTAATADPRS